MVLPDGLKTSIDEMKQCDIFQKTFAIPENELQLTVEESQARNDWSTTRNQLTIHVLPHVRQLPQFCSTQEKILDSSVIPPIFNSGKVAARSSMKEQRSGRPYPPQLQQWDNFDELTGQPFENAGDNLGDGVVISNPLATSLSYPEIMSDEKEEGAFLKAQVWGPLRQTGLFQGVFKEEVGDVSRRPVTVAGRPDNVSVFVSAKRSKKKATTIGSDEPQETAPPILELAKAVPTTLERVEPPNSIFGPYFEFEEKNFVQFVSFEE